MIALPVGIVATSFSEVIHRRQFVVTWGMIARVPLFADLTAEEVAAIMRLLRSQTVESGMIVVRRGDVGHSMYFIASGQVEIELPGGSATSWGGSILRRDRRAEECKAERNRPGHDADTTARCWMRPISGP